MVLPKVLLGYGMSGTGVEEQLVSLDISIIIILPKISRLNFR